jgi:hypothetical protein
MAQSSGNFPKMQALTDMDLETLQSIRFQVVTVIPGGPAAAIRNMTLKELVDFLSVAYSTGELVVRVQARSTLGVPAVSEMLAAVLGIRAASPPPEGKDKEGMDGNKTMVLPPRPPPPDPQ